MDATDVGQIKAGNQVIITVGNATQNVFGTVSSVGIVATTTSGVASFPVVVAVTGSPTGVYPGATASLQIVYKQLSDVLLVPTLAISRSNGTATVLVQNGDKQERRTIQTGISSGAQTQVTGGLSEGEQVLVAIPTGVGTAAPAAPPAGPAGSRAAARAPSRAAPATAGSATGAGSALAGPEPAGGPAPGPARGPARGTGRDVPGVRSSRRSSSWTTSPRPTAPAPWRCTRCAA